MVALVDDDQSVPGGQFGDVVGPSERLQGGDVDDAGGPTAPAAALAQNKDEVRIYAWAINYPPPLCLCPTGGRAFLSVPASVVPVVGYQPT